MHPFPVNAQTNRHGVFALRQANGNFLDRNAITVNPQNTRRIRRGVYEDAGRKRLPPLRLRRHQDIGDQNLLDNPTG
jgi:hypothetical protein